MDKRLFDNFYRNITTDDAIIVNTTEHKYKGCIERIIENDECFILRENRPYGAFYAIRFEDVVTLEIDKNDVPKEYIQGLQI